MNTSAHCRSVERADFATQSLTFNGSNHDVVFVETCAKPLKIQDDTFEAAQRWPVKRPPNPEEILRRNTRLDAGSQERGGAVFDVRPPVTGGSQGRAVAAEPSANDAQHSDD